MIFEQFRSASADVFARFIEPGYQFMLGSGKRWFFAYVIAALLIALLILYRNRYDAALSPVQNLRAAIKRLFSRDVLLHESARLDYRYAVINHLLTSAVVIYLLVAINVLSTVMYAFVNGLGVFDGVGLTIGWFGSALILLVYAFAYDTANFFQHYLQHKSPILWEFHKVHHSAEVLTPVTAVRLHPVAQLVSATVSALVFGILNGLAFNIFAGNAAEYSLLAANLFSFLFYTVGLYHLKHSHVWFTYPGFLKEIFASPSLHLIHHSNRPKHYDKNFGFVFTFWDRVFGSYYDPREDDQQNLILGISESEGRDEYKTVRQLYTTPFKRAWKYHLKPAFTKGGKDRTQP